MSDLIRSLRKAARLLTKNVDSYIKAEETLPYQADDLIEQQQKRIAELETEVNEAVKEKDMERYHRRAVDEENETLKARVMEYERLHRELATTLEHDAESPSLCGLVAVARTIPKERDALKAHVEQLCAALKHLHHNAKASGAEMGLALDVAEEALQLTPQQSLAERDYTIAYNAFHAGVVYADTVPKGTGDTPGAANEYAKRIKDV